MSKISNVLNMIEYLSTGRKYSIRELSSLLEVTPRMVRVYKDEIEKAGIYIDTIKGPYGGYVLNQDVSMPRRFGLRKEIRLEDSNVYNKLSKAINDKKKCLIKYESKDGNVLKRKIVPYELIVLRNEWGVAAYCELRCEIRHFYLNRIKFIEIL